MPFATGAFQELVHRGSVSLDGLKGGTRWAVGVYHTSR